MTDHHLSRWESVPELNHRYHFWRTACFVTWTAIGLALLLLSR